MDLVLGVGRRYPPPPIDEIPGHGEENR